MQQQLKVLNLLDVESKLMNDKVLEDLANVLHFSAFLVNTADRVIRVYDAKEVLACKKDEDPEPVQKLQDLVNK